MPIIIKGDVEGGDAVLRELQQAGPKAQKSAAQKVRGTSFALERRLKSDMPVDSGRARASWGHWQPGEIIKPDSEANKGDAHWEERDGGLTVEQGSNVPYIAALNEGHSRQAPAGFIDKAVDWAQRALVSEISKLLNEVFG